MTTSVQVPLIELQNEALDKISPAADAYAKTKHATAVYVQGVLFALNIAQRAELKGYQTREKLQAEVGDDIILFPDEYYELRYRAAYHGASLAPESPDTPDAIHSRITNNLYNYGFEPDYTQLYTPWAYRFTPEALRRVLRNDYFWTASDFADGSLHRLCLEGDEED